MFYLRLEEDVIFEEDEARLEDRETKTMKFS